MNDVPNRRLTNVPVSRAIHLPPGPLGDELRRGLAAIDQIHRDGDLTQIPAIPRAPRRGESAYEWHPSSGTPLWILIHPDARDPGLSLVHEIGHFLDHQAIGRMGAYASRTGSLLKGWREAIQAGHEYDALSSLLRETSDFLDEAYLVYLLKYDELWARSYAQYIATRSEDPELLAQIARRRQGNPRTIPPHRHWSDADFVPIATEISVILERLRWLT